MTFTYSIAAIFALILVSILYYRCQPPLSRPQKMLLRVLRGIVLWILISILLEPIAYYISSFSEQPQVIFLQDISRSMELKKGGKKKSEILQPSLAKLAESYRQAGYKVKHYPFGDGLSGGKENSLLMKSLQELSDKGSLKNAAAIVLASDGWLKDEELGSLGSLALPIHTLADSSREEIPDLEIVSVNSNQYAYRNEPNLFRVKAKATNFSGSATLNLFIGTAKVATKNINLEPENEATVDFEHKFSQLGFFGYRLEIVPAAQEKNLGNNSLPGAIEVLSEKEQILVISDAPAWDNKFILDAIGSNPRWESIFYQAKEDGIYLAEKRMELPGKSLPAVMVIVNNGKMKLDSGTLQQIKANWQKGSGILYQGLPIAELGEILPIQRSNITTPYQGFIRLTTLAKEYPMLEDLRKEQSKLPPLDYYYVTAAKGAEVLASLNNPQNSPAIVAYTAPQARALGFSFLNLWRWQLMSADKGYQKLMVNSLTWLSNKALGAYSAIYKSSYLQGEKVAIRLRAEDEIRISDLDASPEIRIFDSKGTELKRDFLSRKGKEYLYEAELKDAGEYRFEISEGSRKTGGRFQISESRLEERDFGFNLSLLEYIAKSSRGKMVYPDSDFPILKAQRIQRTVKDEFALYKKWYIISIFILAFGLELFFRRRWGLL
ncbi:MAG: hypothetical protein PHC50_09785 [Candidatus Cloacimonetes bacterium]|nr:hypothetical protein [Candidatus Cloacimonadota bacterium]